jgi:hypothetical protein
MHVYVYLHACARCTRVLAARAHALQFSSKKDGIIKVFVRPDNYVYVDKERAGAGLLGRIASAFKGGSGAGDGAGAASSAEHGGDGTVKSVAKTGAASAAAGTIASALSGGSGGKDEAHADEEQKKKEGGGGGGGFFSHLFGSSSSHKDPPITHPSKQTITHGDVQKRG